VRHYLVLIAAALFLAGCGSSDSPTSKPEVAPKGGISISSSAFGANAAIPKTFTCSGRNDSPPLKWDGVPSATKRLTLIMRDLDAHFVHWQVRGIDPDVTSVAQGKTPAGGKASANSFGTKGYSGPCPPEGEGPHHYAFIVTALGAKGKVLARGSLAGTFAR
jgi:Raf kinase inhibitor-like YbhB/YbcL family protein